MNNFRQLEEILLHANAENIGEAMNLIADDFREFGSSGRVHTKSDVVEYLKQPRDAPWQIEDFEVQNLAPAVALVTYRIVETRPGGETKISMRSSLWQQRDEKWQLVFHQGTRVTM
jgi:hypothetical protein